VDTYDLVDELSSRSWPEHGWPSGIIAAAEKELPIAEGHLAKAQAVLGEAIQAEKVDVIPSQYRTSSTRLSAGRRLSRLFFHRHRHAGRNDRHCWRLGCNKKWRWHHGRRGLEAAGRFDLGADSDSDFGRHLDKKANSGLLQSSNSALLYYPHFAKIFSCCG